MITGSLQIKKDFYYAALNLKENGKRKVKWVAMGLAVKGNKRKAELMLRDILQNTTNWMPQVWQPPPIFYSLIICNAGWVL